VAVPLSLVGTFGVMYMLGFSLNNLTLMALTISTGFVVDDAIVMIENIARYGRTLTWVLARQRATLLVFVATLVATVYLFYVVPKGFFPVQDTGVILG